jgi:hypothetical protein
MPPQQPHVARLRHRLLLQVRHVVGVRQPAAPLGEQVAQLEVAEPDQVEVEAHVAQLADSSSRSRSSSQPAFSASLLSAMTSARF